MGNTGQPVVAEEFAACFALAKHAIKPKQQALFTQFAQAFFSDFLLEDWAERSDAERAAALLAVWQVMQQPLTTNCQIDWPLLPKSAEEKTRRSRLVIVQLDKPFLVDSLRMAFNRLHIPILVLKSTLFWVAREQGKIIALQGLRGAMPAEHHHKEALFYLELNSLTPQQQDQINRELEQVFKDVTSLVQDYGALLTAVNNLQDELPAGPQVDEAQAFLQWLKDGHFTFLGYRQFDFVGRGNEPGLRENDTARLGVFRKLPPSDAGQWSPGIANFYASDEVIALSKSSTRSTVHRHAYPDYVVVKRFDKNGKVIGEARLLGLFTYPVYTLTPFDIPLLRVKVAKVLDMSGFDPVSHQGKNLRRVIEHYPRDELFQATTAELYDTLLGVARINERRVVKLFFRRDPFGRFVTVVAYVPRDVYNTNLRLGMESLIGSVLNSAELDSTTHFSESILARAHMVFRLSPDSPTTLDTQALEKAVQALARSWQEGLAEAIEDLYEETVAQAHIVRYQRAFPSTYQASFSAAQALADMAFIEQLSAESPVALDITRLPEDSHRFAFKLFHLGSLIELSEVVPLLEHLGLKAVGEHSYCITPVAHNAIEIANVYLHHFQLRAHTPIALDADLLRQLFTPAFLALWRKEAENDGFNRLILAAALPWRDVVVLRAYAGYLKQTLFPFAADAIADALVKHLGATQLLVKLFHSQFAPGPNPLHTQSLREEFLKRLDAVDNLNEDRILHRYADLISASLRTNFYQTAKNGKPKPYLSIKLAPRQLADIPEPRPLFEIYVYSAQVEGVHLRTSPVARGGLRWSDRLQDYRTEVLGLVKAQQVKNSVIVPSGAKGGFVPKLMPLFASRDQLQAEGIACYKIFIQGLLDLTDNYVNGELVPPPQVVCRDAPDPYLVVAADKGTATFSDIANSLSAAYGHWLGDAFASGGSQGYDHKAMGITARGAWVAVERHFRELGRSTTKADFSVVGIGDMAGDVFGNGMLLSPHICLLAAFNHQHIFIDPTPNAQSSFKERERLFKLPRSSWADYSADLISAGGGVFLRSAKAIVITPQMRAALDIQADKLTPNELINTLLKAPVDLIWNGGIGTYVKSSAQSHSDIGDKANDALRVNGAELRCKIFGEGGNLGMSQLGRIEYCLNGGACNTDFIDNAGGVDCSDHEVNIKIALDEMVAAGTLSSKQRSQLLVSMTQEVAALVLQNVARQTQALSLAQAQAQRRMTEYQRFIHYLETTGRLNRRLEFLPSDEGLQERESQGKALTRPELAILMSYAKVMLKEEFTCASIAEDPYLAQAALGAFPPKLHQKYPAQLASHRLLPQLVATQIANDFVNNVGITAIHRLVQSTGASFPDIAKAYVTARDIFDFEGFQQFLAHSQEVINADQQLQLLTNMNRRLRRATRWFLRNRRQVIKPGVEVPVFSRGLLAVVAGLEQNNGGATTEQFAVDKLRYQSLGVPDIWARKLALPNNLFSGLCIIEASLQHQLDATEVTQSFYRLQDALNLSWFASALSDIKVDNFWQAQVREAYLDDLEVQMRRMAVAFLRCAPAEELMVWLNRQHKLLSRWQLLQQEVQSQHLSDFAIFAVAMRHLSDLAEALERDGQL